MRCLVTGGSGFIGSHLIEKLESIGDEVENIDLQIGKDIRDIDKYATGTYDRIYHLASSSDVRGGLTNTSVDLENIIIGTHAILEYMRKNNCKNLIYTSSSTVYGEGTGLPLKEDVGDLRPISLYAACKLACEKLIHAYSHMFGFNVCVYRFGNIIGDGCKGRVIWDCVNKAKRNKEILPMLGDGNQTRQYVHYSDCIDAIINVSFKNDECFEIYNVSGGNPIKVKELVAYILDEINKDNLKVEYEDKDRGWIGDVPITLLDSSKLCEMGWKQNISPEDAIRRTAKWANETIQL